MIDCSLYILISFLVSMLLGLGLIPLVVSFCKVKRIYDLPNERKVHKVFVPRLGGVCFIPCVVISFMLATAIVSRISEGTSLSLSLWTCYFSVGLLAIYVAGVVDDIVGAYWTGTGICAHQSAMEGGAVIPVPEFKKYR